MAFPPPPAPKSRLGLYRLLAPSASVRVSPLCIGGMSLGDAWGAFMGGVSKKEAFEILDYFHDQGGNFIDTANNYQNEQSEEWIGEWMAQKKVRDEMVIATKFTVPFAVHRSEGHVAINQGGNSKKSMFVSLEASLKKLQTSYVDILYLHVWDHTTSIEEIMNALHILVQTGKVLYLGVSDTPAWIVSKANQYARDHGLTPFVIYQGKWSLQHRDLERDVIPMCRAEGMAIAPWAALGGGLFKSDEEIENLKKSGDVARNPTLYGPKGYSGTREISRALEKVAKRHNSTITGVALAYVMAKTVNVFPIIGVRKVSHLQGNIEALSNVQLTEEDIKELEESSPLEVGFPHDFIGNHPSSNPIINRGGYTQFADHPKALPLGPLNIPSKK